MTMDPGALGTLINGLRSIEAEREAYDAGEVPEEAPAPVRRPLRATLARGLRAVADRLEPARWETKRAA